MYRQKSLQNKKDKTEDSTTDEIMKILHAQQSCQVIHSVVVMSDKYLFVLKDDRQIQDIAQFCTSENVCLGRGYYL